MPCLIIKKWPNDQSFRRSRTQGEAEERNVQWTFRRPNADIARAVSLGRRGM